MQQRASSYPPMPIIVGAPRSGTTLLRFMLDSHPTMTIPPETGFLVPCAQLTSRGTILRQDLFQVVTRYPPDAPGWHDFQIPEGTFLARLGEIEPFTVAEGIRAFYQLYASRFGKLRWGDKTPLYCMHLQTIEAILPEAHFIHIIRDGRDVAMSLRQMWFSPGRDIETLATHWCQWVTTARQQGTRCRHYMEVRYEQLIEDTRKVLERISQFLDLEYNNRMLRYHEYVPERLQEHKSRFRLDGSLLVTQEQRLRQQYQTTQAPTRSRVFAWKREMHSEERRRFEAIAGEVLREFGFGLE
jgi:sulfotransferase family protein